MARSKAECLFRYINYNVDARNFLNHFQPFQSFLRSSRLGSVSMTSSGLSFINRSICFQLSLFAIRLDNPTVPICWLICDGLAPALLDTLDNYWHAMYLLWEWRGEDQSDYHCDSSTEQPHWERLEGIINSHLICTKPQDMITNVESLPGYCHKIPSLLLHVTHLPHFLYYFLVVQRLSMSALLPSALRSVTGDVHVLLIACGATP